MGEAEFDALLERSMAGLRLQTDAHAGGWGLGHYARWDLKQDVGNLVFTDPVRGMAVAPAQLIGSWFGEDSTWLWGWANPSISDALKRDALRVREFGEANGLEQLVQPEWVYSEADAWRMTALAVHLCGAQGAYRGPAGPAFVFISFGEVQLSK
jgi:hypothetical protein